MATEIQGSTTTFRLVIQGDGSVRTIPLVGERWVVGRSPDCEIVLRDPTVSRRHILIERQGDLFQVRDLGGRNPVLVDGKPRTEAQVGVGQTVAVGMTLLTIESRRRPHLIESSSDTVVITGREVIDSELVEDPGDGLAAAAQQILEQIEWTFADLGSLGDAADPLLELALNLTRHQRGFIGQFLPSGGLEALAARDLRSNDAPAMMPDKVLLEARRICQPLLLTASDEKRSRCRLVVPLGPRPDALLVLEQPSKDAPEGQALLRLARSIGTVTWHRLSEVRERLRLRDEVERLRFHGSAAHNAVLTSTRLQGTRQHLRELANNDRAVLLVGEDGTEREDLARYLHAEGNRRQHAFVAMNLANVPGFHIERELFGDRTERGALTAAEHGTLSLDNFLQLTPHLQERLFRELRAADSPRLVASAGVAPDPADGAWYGPAAEILGAHTVPIPPLRDEPTDVLALAELFLSDMGANPDGSPRLLSERTRRILVAYRWPGNVRQLRLVLEGAAARAGTNQIAPRHLPSELTEEDGAGERAVLSLEDIERQHIRDVLRRLGGNRFKTAQALGIASSTLYEKLRRYGVDA